MISNAAFASETDTTHYKKNDVIFMPFYSTNNNNDDFNSLLYSITLGYERMYSKKIKLGFNVNYINEYIKYKKYVVSSYENNYSISTIAFYNLLFKKKKNELWLGFSATINNERNTYTLEDSSKHVYKYKAAIIPGVAIQFFHNFTDKISVGFSYYGSKNKSRFAFHYLTLAGFVLKYNF